MNQENQLGIYIFCGIQTETDHPFGVIEMEGKTRELFAIQYKDAAFVAAEVPMKIFHPNKDNLMMHQQAVSLVMEQSDTVIPVSFGNVFQSEDDVKILLENLYPQFKALFPKIKGKIEVGLKVIGKKEWLESQIKENSQLVAMAANVQGKSAAAGLYERIQLGGAAHELIAKLQQDLKQEVFEPLKESAEAATTNDPVSEKMLLNASFLIDKEREDEFDRRVNAAHDKWKDRTNFKYSGPWPAYNFINIRLKVEDH